MLHELCIWEGIYWKHGLDIYCMFAYYCPTLNKGHYTMYKGHIHGIAHFHLTALCDPGKEKLNEKKKTSSVRSIKACVR